VAGTGSQKPYLFNADNVARNAPEAWHSPGTVVDGSYDAMDRRARAACAAAGPGPAWLQGVAEPVCLAEPPSELGFVAAAPALQALAERLAGREVWLVHPWSLRAPAPDAADAVILGVCVAEQHAAWPWPAARWRWVAAAMDEVAPQRVFAAAGMLASLLAGAARVRSVDDPHVNRWLHPLARLDPAPALFPPVTRRCDSFTQWWRRATEGRYRASELLE
jgi:deoxyribodipyrimidine photo-lyase